MSSRVLRHDIQQLRGVAVLAVIVNHLGIGWLPGGYLGVDVFFTVSGFVIANSILSGELKQTSRIKFFTQFWIRRMFRLWPALFLTVVTTIGLLVITGLTEPDSTLTGLTAVLGLSNFRLILGQLDYFAFDISGDWFMHTWSLAVEEQIYLMLALVFTAVGGGVRVRSSSRRLGVIATVIGALAVLSLVMSFGSFGSELVRFYSPHTRFYQVASGVLLALVRIGTEDKAFERSATVRNSIRLGALIALVILFATEFVATASASLAATVITVMILASATPAHWARGIVDARWLRAVGDRSYSLYLVHWPAQLFAIQFVDGLVRQLLVSIGLTLALGMFSYRWIEITTRHLWRVLRGRTALGVALLSLVATATVAAIVYQNVEQQTLDETQDQRNERTGKNLQAALDACSNDASDVWVVGDSHLGAVIHGISELRQRDCKLIGNFGFDEGLFALSSASTTFGSQSARSATLRSLDDLIKRVRDERPKVLVIVNFLTGLMSDPETASASANWVTVEWYDATGVRVTRQQFLRLFEHALRTLINTMSEHEGTVVVASPPPDFDWLREPKDSVLDYNFEDLCAGMSINVQTRRRIASECDIWRSESTKTRDEHQRRTGEIHSLLNELQETSDSFKHVALDVAFCNPRNCSNFVDGVPAYIDDDHLNEFGASLAVSGFGDVLRLGAVSGP